VRAVARLAGVDDQPGAAGGAELGGDVGDVIAYRLRADAQFLVRTPFRASSTAFGACEFPKLRGYAINYPSRSPS
jgi:hypothetical protein